MGPQGAAAILPLGYLEHLASGGRDEALAAVLGVWSPTRTLRPFWGFRLGGHPPRTPEFAIENARIVLWR
jgi:hypothetical protein